MWSRVFFLEHSVVSSSRCSSRHSATTLMSLKQANIPSDKSTVFNLCYKLEYHTVSRSVDDSLTILSRNVLHGNCRSSVTALSKWLNNIVEPFYRVVAPSFLVSHISRHCENVSSSKGKGVLYTGAISDK